MWERESSRELERALKEIEHLKGVIRNQEDYIEEIVNGQNNVMETGSTKPFLTFPN